MEEGCSVIIPTKDRPRTVENAIESVLRQDYKGPVEIIVVDDSNKIKKTKYADITHVEGTHDGAPAARNLGYRMSKYDFICFLDDDDIWHSTKIRKQISYMKSNPNCPLCICYSRDYRFNMERTSKPPETVTHRMIIKSFNLSSTSSYMLRRTFCEQLIRDDNTLFDPQLQSAQEYDLAIRISRYGNVHTIEEELMTQYETDKQISQNPKRKVLGIYQIFRKHRHEYEAIDYIKTFGLILMFYLSMITGNKIYIILKPLKEMYEK
jgi:glycosyltransferase involved in cell wall biosynthesis